MSSIFLSHSHADKPFARRLAADLRLAGHSVWIDEAEINIGDSLIEKIRDGLDQVDYVAAILSSASIASPWVTRELDIASNREIKENRAVVLPLMVERVDLPGFLEGKFYGDFTDPDQYKDTLDRLLRALGPSTPVQMEPNELERLKEELAAAQAAAAQHQSALRAHQTIALRGKSPKLVQAIEKANERYPSHAPINATYAFEVVGMPMTLDYLLWCIGKAERKGGHHQMDILLSMDNKWGEVKSMLQAYSDLLEAQ